MDLITGGERMKGFRNFPIGSTRWLLAFANWRIDPVMIPGQLEPPPARLPLNTRSSDHPGKCASGVGTTGEAKDIYFIPWIELVDNEFITGLNDFFQSQANGTPEQPLDDTTIVANPVMVENFLQRPIGSFWFNQPLETFLVPGIEFRDVGISLDPLPVPGAVDQNDNALHERCIDYRADHRRIW